MLDHPLTALSPQEVYDASTLDCYAFRRGGDVRRGLSLALGNMVAGFGFDLQGVHFHNSECAYIAGMFSLDTPEHTAIVRQLVACDDGWEAKKKIRRRMSRSDERTGSHSMSHGCITWSGRSA